MGLSVEDINKGVADIGSIISNSMEALNKILGKVPTSTGGITAAPNQPQTASQPQGTAQESGTINVAVILLAAILLVVLLRR